MFKKQNSKYILIEQNNTHLYFLSLFLCDTAYYFFRMDVQAIIQELYHLNSEGQSFELVELDFDITEDAFYISEPSNVDTNLSHLDLCKQNKIKYNKIKKNNLIDIVQLWDQAWKNKSPFALLYQDDTGWYDIKAFDSEDDMRKFIADHQL